MKTAFVCLTSLFGAGSLLILCSLSAMSVSAQTFVNRTYDAGLDAMWQGNGVAAADYDGDGDLDVYLVSRLTHDDFNPRTWNRLYRNNGDGTFTETTLEAGVRAEFLPSFSPKLFGNKWSASWGDYDRDGDPDLFLTNVGPEILFRNNGDGTFSDVSEEAGINAGLPASDENETSGGTWWDYNLDGYLDLYVSSWVGRNRFYRNNQDGTFTDIAPETGLDYLDQTLLSMSWDVDDDGLPDLYLANDFGPNRFLKNLGDDEFEDITDAIGLGDDGESMGLAFGDVNGDLLPELFISNNATRRDRKLNTFYLGSQDWPLIDVAETYGIANTDWAWGSEFADADLDGDLDLFVVNGILLENNTPNRYFRNMYREEGALRWADESTSSGMNGRDESHGLLVFDSNDDGALDLLITNWGTPVYFLQNQGSSRRWLKVNLVGVQSNPHGFGSEIRVASGSSVQNRFYNGVDYLGQSIQPAHFGMGSDASYEYIEVVWPGGFRERFDGGPSSRIVTLVEGTGTPITTTVKDNSVVSGRVDIYPNPASQTLFIEAEDAIKWEVLDLMGRKVAVSIGPVGMRSTVNVATWASGLYVVRITRGATNRTEIHLIPIVN